MHDARRGSLKACGATALLLGTCLVIIGGTPRGALAAGSSPAAESRPSASAIDWGWDRDKAMAIARGERRPVLIDFWATWCQPCREMEAKLWSRPDVVPLASRFVCLRVDIDRHPEVANRYRVESIPTVVFVDPWGTELASRVGFKGPEEVLGLLQAMPADFSEVAPLQERFAANPRDVEAIRALGLAYHRLKLFDTSTEFLDKVIASKEARSKPDMLAEALTVVGWNSLKTGNLRRAKKSFERCLKEVPTHPALDVTLYGLFAVHVAEGDRKEAEPLLGRLESCCPGSALTARARKDIESPLVQSR